MSHQVSVWRAAQLVGVARGVLQQQVRAGALILNEGFVSTDALLRLYPSAKLEESGLLERVTQIRDEAFGKRVRERLLPSQEVLAQRLFAQSQELARRILILEQQSYEVAGRPFNLGSPKQIGEFFFKELGLPVVAKTPTGAPSTSEEVLEQLGQALMVLI